MDILLLTKDDPNIIAAVVRFYQRHYEDDYERVDSKTLKRSLTLPNTECMYATMNNELCGIITGAVYRDYCLVTEFLISREQRNFQHARELRNKFFDYLKNERNVSTVGFLFEGKYLHLYQRMNKGLQIKSGRIVRLINQMP